MKKRAPQPTTPIYKQLLDAWHRHTRMLGYSENGRQIKAANLAECLIWLEGQGITDITAVAPAHITAHYRYLKQRPNKRSEGLLSAKTIAGHMRSIRGFFAWLQASGQITLNPMSALDFPYPKPDNTRRTVLTQAEVRQLYAAAETLTERAVLGLGYGCGLRAGELSGVNLADVRLDEGILIVAKGKGGKRRVVPLSGGVARDLRRYIDAERGLHESGESANALILNIKGTRLRPYTARKRLAKLVERTGNAAIAAKRPGLHTLRHSIATHLLEQGVPVEQVRQFLGHSQLETTEIYTRVSQKQLKDLLQ